jgi:hypothetical protein
LIFIVVVVSVCFFLSWPARTAILLLKLLM